MKFRPEEAGRTPYVPEDGGINATPSTETLFHAMRALKREIDTRGPKLEKLSAIIDTLRTEAREHSYGEKFEEALNTLTELSQQELLIRTEFDELSDEFAHLAEDWEAAKRRMH